MSTKTRKESGVEELRRVARASTMTRESAFDGFTAEQCLQLMRACWASGWDVLPDDLLAEERQHAAQFGMLDAEAAERLREKFA